MNVDFTDTEIERLLKIMNIALKTEGVSLAVDCAAIVLKLNSAKMNNQESEVEEVPDSERKVLISKKKNESRATKS